ncbi:unnamed protein product [Moneuplotes crassus]|uniref:Uncharacterized protein n=1 Tax=Euplotes crassus TaxID=5936 RepID=A0AAD2CXZ8_EUPCR|nr:unnamed protein product [Moneuplotes crassus]
MAFYLKNNSLDARSFENIKRKKNPMTPYENSRYKGRNTGLSKSNSHRYRKMDVNTYKLYHQPIQRAKKYLQIIQDLREQYSLGKKFQFRPSSKERPHIIRRSQPEMNLRDDHITKSAKDFPGVLCSTNVNMEVVSHKKKQKKILQAKLDVIKQMKHIKQLKLAKNPAVLSDCSSTDYEDPDRKKREKKAKITITQKVCSLKTSRAFNRRKGSLKSQSRGNAAKYSKTPRIHGKMYINPERRVRLYSRSRISRRG